MSTWLTIFLFSILASTAQAIEDVQFQRYEYECEGQHVGAEFGHFSVPERHSVPGGRKIRLAFLRLKSTSSNPGRPIFYLAGGPGGSGIALAKGPRGALFLRMRESGDVIVLDQRGVGLSEPNLNCPGSLGFPLTAPGDLVPLLKRFEDASRSCAGFWRDRGVEVAAYNVVENAHDVDSLRQALGAPKIVLWGSSYGTHLGMAIIRHHGPSVLLAVFSGVEGPDQTLKMPRTVEAQLTAIGRLIARSPVLSPRVPNLANLVRRVLVDAERTPFVVPMADAELPERARVVLGRFDMEQLVVGMIGTRSGIAKLPATLLAFEKRELSSRLVQEVAHEIVATRTGSIGSAMSYAMDCSSSASGQRFTRIASEMQQTFVAHLDFPIPDVCNAWNVPPLPDRERTVVRSPIHVMFLSGTLDARTPPRNVEEIRQGFPNSHHVLIEGAGHGDDLFVSSPEIFEVTMDFIKTGSVRVRRIELPALRFE
ncbi:MAG TPA: alpha/beta hydrolase [Bryobacteraceae bacterium]|nr:alpha/beta hydrolase [Bryobacteraceae bacterium]